MQGESSEAGRMGAPIHQLRADHRTGVGDEASLDALTDRQRAVLDAVLDLIVEGRRPLSMIAVARAASCSKETLYRWFGDRAGLLTATVRWQAAKVRGVKLPEGSIDEAYLLAELKRFAVDWLTVISGQTSVALNRLAIAEAGSDALNLGEIVLRNGPTAMARRLEPLLATARADGLVTYESEGEAFTTFFGLVVGDVQIRLLLGEAIGLDAPAIDRAASNAATRFLALYGRKAGAGAPIPPQKGGSST